MSDKHFEIVAELTREELSIPSLANEAPLPEDFDAGSGSPFLLPPATSDRLPIEVVTGTRTKDCIVW